MRNVLAKRLHTERAAGTVSSSRMNDQAGCVAVQQHCVCSGDASDAGEAADRVVLQPD
jgi:hypothetical protein